VLVTTLSGLIPTCVAASHLAEQSVRSPKSATQCRTKRSGPISPSTGHLRSRQLNLSLPAQPYSPSILPFITSRCP
jgi:hypothetical protein